MNNIFKHFNKIDISEIADSEASKVTTAVFKIHKTFCSTCRNIFNEYKILSEKVISTFKLEEKKITTRSDKVYQLYSYTLKAAVYALVVGVTFSTVGIAFAQTQTEVDIIPDVTFFEDGNLIAFSEEEIENLFSEVLDPIQATLITFVNPEIITADEVVEVVEEQIDVLTTLVATEEETLEVVEELVTEEEILEVVEEVVTAELTGLDNALSQIEANIATALENNNLNALNGLENAKEKVLKNIEKAQKKLEEGKEKADKEISKAQEKAQNEIKKAQEKAEEIISEVKDDASEKDVVKAQLKAERTLEKAQEKAEKELEKAQEKAEKELEKAEKEAEKELEKAEKEAEKAQKEAEKSKGK